MFGIPLFTADIRSQANRYPSASKPRSTIEKVKNVASEINLITNYRDYLIIKLSEKNNVTTKTEKETGCLGSGMMNKDTKEGPASHR